ncbi:MAG TPA: type VI secretion system contractile sheath large subunit, partial [Acetobacteraceae bacterium]|nr:type VI secretion system contractile sheath large subunit [Acetobacteraceae bacterium]
MNDSSSAIEEIIAATAPPDGGVATPEPASPDLRGAILSGRFLGLRDYALEDALTGFLAAENDAALAHWLPQGWTGSADDVRGLLDRDIVAIDAMLSEQLDAILHHDRVRRLEGTWRGLAWLVGGIESGSRLKTKILNIGWGEICRDLERAVEFDQSNLFRKIYEEEFGMPGGEPYGLMIVDHDIRHRAGPNSRTDDVSALAALAGVAAAAFCPTLVGASPVLL